MRKSFLALLFIPCVIFVMVDHVKGTSEPTLAWQFKTGG